MQLRLSPPFATLRWRLTGAVPFPGRHADPLCIDLFSEVNGVQRIVKKRVDIMCRNEMAPQHEDLACAHAVVSTLWMVPGLPDGPYGKDLSRVAQRFPLSDRLLLASDVRTVVVQRLPPRRAATSSQLNDPSMSAPSGTGAKARPQNSSNVMLAQPQGVHQVDAEVRPEPGTVHRESTHSPVALIPSLRRHSSSLLDSGAGVLTSCYAEERAQHGIPL